MKSEHFALCGRRIRLEPLEHRHVDGLVAAAAVDTSIYRWSLVPQGEDAVTRYVDIAIAWREAGTAVPFAIVRADDGAVIGSTRFWAMERWSWPEGHAQYGRSTPDVCEIGYTWLTAPAVRTAVNTEAKLLMLAHAFEVWRVWGVCLHTDERNERSRAAMERMGARLDGVLRAHRMASDFTPRDSARYSIIAAEWPDVKARLERLRDKYD
ncbi:MAG TPA: GNAT family protein [Acidobacteriaceae bacterium]